MSSEKSSEKELRELRSIDYLYALEGFKRFIKTSLLLRKDRKVLMKIYRVLEHLYKSYERLEKVNKKLEAIVLSSGSNSLLSIASLIFEKKRVDIAYIIENTSFSRQTIYNTLRKLREKGFIVRKSRGIYQLSKKYWSYRWETFRDLVLISV